MKRRDLYFVLFVTLSFGLFWTPLSTLVSQALQYDHYSHILVVPVISTCFIYWIDRNKIFQNVRPCLRGAALLFALAAGLYWLWRSPSARKHKKKFFFFFF